MAFHGFRFAGTGHHLQFTWSVEVSGIAMFHTLHLIPTLFNPVNLVLKGQKGGKSYSWCFCDDGECGFIASNNLKWSCGDAPHPSSNEVLL